MQNQNINQNNKTAPQFPAYSAEEACPVIKFNALLIIIIIGVFILGSALAGAGVYFWQSSNTHDARNNQQIIDTLTMQNQELQEQITALQEELEEKELQIQELEVQPQEPDEINQP